MTDLSSLISSVLACPEVGDRSLDADIAEAMGQVPEGATRQGNIFLIASADPNRFAAWYAPELTTSIDAGEALRKSALPGWRWSSVLFWPRETIATLLPPLFEAPLVEAKHECELNARLAAVLKAKEQERG